MLIRPFREADFQIYEQWFADAELNRRLGPLDRVWLECVMSESSHRQYSIWESTDLVAVAGVESASIDHPYWYVTDLAVKPELRGSGIGSQVLSLLCQFPDHQSVRVWRAGVMKSNPQAARFLEHNGWKRLESTGVEPTATELWDYELRL